MRLIGVVLALCLAMAALKAAASLIALVIVVLALLRPIETLKLVAGVICVGIACRFPVVAILATGAVIAAGKVLPRAK